MTNRITGFAEASRVVRVDLHCHSSASNEADEALLNAIKCPESYSSPGDVYEQAKSRGMDYFTVTDHDSIGGVSRLSDREYVIVGEEVTCWFPEDRCKIHLLVWGLTADDHDAMQAVADDIYKVAAVVELRRLAHAVAHPVYRQNDRLERWHLERLILMFKGFETLNGAHSVLHRRAFEPLLDELTPASMAGLSATHGMAARWPEPHVKARTGGSDDHGLFNVGRTWTEFGNGVETAVDILEAIRQGRCRPGGEAGSSLKLAHNFFGVGIRYYGQKIRGGRPTTSIGGMVLKTLVGERRTLRRRDVVKAVVKHKVKTIGRRLVRPFHTPAPPTGSALLLDLFVKSCGHRFKDFDAITSAVRSGGAVLGEHTAMFDLLSVVNRDIADGIAESVTRSLDTGKLTGLFDSVSAVVTHQFLLMPYYFAMFHQNRERHLLPRMTGHGVGKTFKIGVFTDTFDEVTGVGRFIRDMSRQARETGRDLTVMTSTTDPRVECASRRNFVPLLSRPMPCYADQPLTIPPLAEILEWCDREQFDAIHVHTPGPMGLCGWAAAKMLRVPLLGTYHTDFPGYVQQLTGDHRLSTGATAYMKWFYGQTGSVLSRSRDYKAKLRAMGFADDRIGTALPCVDTVKFHPDNRESSIWSDLHVVQPYKLLYAGRVSPEKNLPFLAEAFRHLCRSRSDVALVLAGDGPYRAEMERALAGLPVYFLGFKDDTTLPAIYASADLFVFPSETDTLGQVVIEAQASGLPVVVSDVGGPKEVMDDGITGLVIPANSAGRWAASIDGLLSDTPRRMRMSRTAPQRMARFSLAATFDSFWDQHERRSDNTVGRRAGMKIATPAGVESLV